MTIKPQSTTEALEPCPFCGAAPNLKQVPSKTQSANYWWIGCEIKGTPQKDLIGCGIGHSAWSKDEVIAKWNTRISPASAAPVVARSLYSELIHIAAELARGDGFLSSCAEDMNPRLKRADILKTVEGQEHRLKDWAYRVRQVANKLSPAATAAPVEQSDADHIADGAIGCRNCGDTWERTVAPDGTVAACEDCGDGSYSLVTPELVRLRQAIGWICDAADGAYNEDANNERIHEIFNIAAKAAGITRRLPDEHGRFDETSIG